ncbi:hypothetical protein RHECNPAF_89004 [Rhizobium etli CNPAF512]|nr:hypothetical protein RHECNPAF_89004 [Rhizobium etli CNPAF512]
MTPSQVRYRAALRPDLPKRLASFSFSARAMQAEKTGLPQKGSSSAGNNQIAAIFSRPSAVWRGCHA